MISVVCVYNNESILKVALLRSLKSQTGKHEMILLDNREGRYKSAAQALNEGGRMAAGDFIMFIHQDMWLATSTWLEDVETILKGLPDVGVAGVAGMSENGRNWHERVKFSINVLEDEGREEQGRVRSPAEVQTLDECVLIVPRSVFEALKFDESTFDGWDCYGADYCLSARESGRKVYVVPLPCNHCTSRASYPVWHFQGLFRYQKRLYKKHHQHFPRIYTWMGTVSWLNLRLRSVVELVGPVYLGLFPNMFVLMKRELRGCNTVLDLGCGHHSPLQICKVPFSIGMDLFKPSLLESRRIAIHSQYLLGDVRKPGLKPKSFEAVIAVEVLEHLPKEEGLQLLHVMEELATKKVIVTTPNGYIRQDPYGDNVLQEHKSGWEVRELRALGFRVRGHAGWKGLRGGKGCIKYRPVYLWDRISDFTQPVVYRFPRLAYQVMAIKRVGQANETRR